MQLQPHEEGAKLAQRQGVKKTKNRTGATKYPEEENRRSVKFRDSAQDLRGAKENKEA